jgi:hypothetical protein
MRSSDARRRQSPLRASALARLEASMSVRRHKSPFLSALLVLFLYACSGGGCSTCEGCGVAPIPGGFPIADRIDNAAQIRLTQQGIEFIEREGPALVPALLGMDLAFDVPRTETRVDVVGTGTRVDVVTVTICPDSNCRIQATLNPADDPIQLTPTAPNRLALKLRLRLKTYNLDGMRAPIPIRAGFLGTVRADIDTERGSRRYVGITANIDFVTETRAARAGYTRIVVRDARLAMGEDIENDDLQLSGGVSFLFNFFKGFIIDQVQGQIGGVLNDAIADQLCTRAGTAGCPTGSTPAGSGPDAVCNFTGTSECVPILLGTDGQGDLGQAFLGGFSPGTHGSGQFLLAAGGDGEAVNEGMSLFFYGGFRSTDTTFTRSPAHNPCVPALTPTSPRSGGGTIADNWGGGTRPTIARVPTFRNNTVPGVRGETHIGIGLSEDYLNYAAYGMFDGGLLCIGAGTRLSQQISTGLFSLLISSLNNLTFPESNAAIALAIRPQEPPRISVGTAETAPLLGILLPKVNIDFYVWSNERYVRFMTYEADLNLGISLTVEGGQIVPMIGSLTATNPRVTNAALLTENTEMLASTITTVLSSFGSMLTSGLSPFDLPEIMGLQLIVPEGGIRGITDSGEDFLGIFARLAPAAPAPLTLAAETSLWVQDLELDPASLRLETFGQGALPRLRINLNASGPTGVEFEYSYRIDGTQWSPWTRDRSFVVEAPQLLLQARHEVEARARVVGEPRTVDPTPARTQVLVDLLAPVVELKQEVTEEGDAIVRVVAADVITPASALRYRHRVAGGAWTEWSSTSTIAVGPQGTNGLEVEVADEAGNVGAARMALIRGIPNPAGGGSCDCGVAGGPTGGDLVLGGFVGLLLLGAARRRRWHRRAGAVARRALSQLPIVLVLAAPAALGVLGCDCGGTNDPPPAACEGMCPLMPDTSMDPVQACCADTNMCVVASPDADCPAGFTCPAASLRFSSCAFTCEPGACTEKPPLDPGQLATFLDMVVGADGTPILSGYAAGVPPRRPYGDLVVGTYDTARMTVDWEIVDGAPSSPIVGGPSGWRGGVQAPGPDVGKWSSIAQGGMGALYVSYYDATSGALKFARRTGTSWQTHVVDDAGDAGRYSSLALDGSGIPMIAYLRVTPPAMAPGRPTSTLVVARAANLSPSEAAEWTLTDVASGPVPCRPQFCGMGQVCLESGECAATTTDCSPGCGDGRACVAGSCQATLPSPYVEDVPPVIGAYASLARTPSGMAVVYYDRTGGNLYGAAFDGTRWGMPFLIDGYAAGRPGVGDSGIGASLYVDDGGDWHVSYVDGAEETLRYARVRAGAVVSTEVVDDGSTDGAMPNTDGRHIVGDDSSIVATASELRIAYQDATAQRVMYATRPIAGGAWRIRVLDAEGSTGYFIEQQLVAGTSYVATWWRREMRPAANGVRILSP